MIERPPVVQKEASVCQELKSSLKSGEIKYFVDFLSSIQFNIFPLFKALQVLVGT